MRLDLLRFFLPLLLFAEKIWARAGGAGGGHSGGHSGGGGHGGDLADPIFELLFDFIFAIFFRTGVFGWILLFLIFIFFMFFMFSRKNTKIDLPENKFSKFKFNVNKANNESPVAEGFFQESGLLDFEIKVKKAFLVIQESWSVKRLDHMRRFITDGVYQRFNAQFTMMNLLGQKNIMSNVRIHNLKIIKAYRDGIYDCVDVAISASAFDKFICDKYPEMNSPGGNSSFVEYWSFIRRHDYQKGSNLFQSETCPKCAALLTAKLVETARCPYCSTYLNSGEYDWVLAEITQENDYNFEKNSHENVMFSEVLKVYPHFSRQLIEDRASNAFMQILIGSATLNINVLKRFCTNELFEMLKINLPRQSLIYNRLYTNSVDVTKVNIEGKKISCDVTIKYSYEKVDYPGNLITQTEVITMMRYLSGISSKGSVFANACSSCGATQKDSLSAVCEYCSWPLNDPNIDWVVEMVRK